MAEDKIFEMCETWERTLGGMRAVAWENFGHLQVILQALKLRKKYKDATEGDGSGGV